MPATVTIVSPTPATAPGSPGAFPTDWATARLTPVIVEITDSVAEFISALYPGALDEIVVYRDGAFRGQFAGTSSESAITSGKRLSILPQQGWPSSDALVDLQLAIEAVDGVGVVATAPSFKSAGSAVSGAGGSPLTPSWGSHATNDIGILICVSSYNTTTVPSTPAGWTLLGSTTGVAGGGRIVVSAFWRRATSGAESAPSVTPPAGDPCSTARVIVFQDCNTAGSPIDALATGGSTGGGGFSLTAPGTTTTVDASLCVNVFGIDANGAPAQAASGYTNATIAMSEVADSTLLFAGEQMGIAVACGELSTAGALASTTATADGSAYCAWGALTFALLPV